MERITLALSNKGLKIEDGKVRKNLFTISAFIYIYRLLFRFLFKYTFKYGHNWTVFSKKISFDIRYIVI